ncbi:MAG TPA: adenosylcobinamide-GDP ribazoletransferase [Acidimicrobiia bacterium]|nr:adenosylcobinamide-GDP ribazoletransferase [Acidimicrobiia bacterium]
MRGFRSAVALLTRVPVGGSDRESGDLTRSVKWIPVVGGLVGLVIGLAYVAASSVMPSLLAAALATGVGVILTGALHEDGLADTMDGFGGGVGPAETMRIMKDPASGVYGVTSIVMSLVLRILSLSTLTSALALVFLPSIHAMSRGGSIGLMTLLRPASERGLGAAHDGPGLRRQVVMGYVFAALIGFAAVGWWAAAFVIVTTLATAVIGLLARRHLEGYTGDVLGAAQQIGEVTSLVLAAALVSTGVYVSLWWV